MKRILFAAILIGWVSITTAQNRVGINTNTPTETLDINGITNLRGALKVNGTAGTAGQILVSQGSGAAPIWQNNMVQTGGSFWATMNNNTHNAGRAGFSVSGETTQEDSLDLAVAKVSGTDITVNNAGLLNNFIAINRTGLYHFEGNIRLFLTSPSSTTLMPRGYVRMLVNEPSGADPNFILVEETMQEEPSSISGVSDFHNVLARFSINIRLQAGATVAFSAGITRIKVVPELIALGQNAGGYVSGHFLSE